MVTKAIGIWMRAAGLVAVMLLGALCAKAAEPAQNTKEKDCAADKEGCKKDPPKADDLKEKHAAAHKEEALKSLRAYLKSKGIADDEELGKLSGDQATAFEHILRSHPDVREHVKTPQSLASVTQLMGAVNGRVPSFGALQRYFDNHVAPTAGEPKAVTDLRRGNLDAIWRQVREPLHGWLREPERAGLRYSEPPPPPRPEHVIASLHDSDYGAASAKKWVDALMKNAGQPAVDAFKSNLEAIVHGGERYAAATALGFLGIAFLDASMVDSLAGKLGDDRLGGTAFGILNDAVRDFKNGLGAVSADVMGPLAERLRGLAASNVPGAERALRILGSYRDQNNEALFFAQLKNPAQAPFAEHGLQDLIHQYKKSGDTQAAERVQGQLLTMAKSKNPEEVNTAYNLLFPYKDEKTQKAFLEQTGHPELWDLSRKYLNGQMYRYKQEGDWGKIAALRATLMADADKSPSIDRRHSALDVLANLRDPKLADFFLKHLQDPAVTNLAARGLFEMVNHRPTPEAVARMADMRAAAQAMMESRNDRTVSASIELQSYLSAAEFGLPAAHRQSSQELLQEARWMASMLHRPGASYEAAEGLKRIIDGMPESKERRAIATIADKQIDALLKKGAPKDLTHDTVIHQFIIPMRGALKYYLSQPERQ